MTPVGPSRAEARLRPPDASWRDPAAPEGKVVRELAAALRLPETVCAVLAVRGLTSPNDAKRFLRPRLDHLHDPALLADGPEAAARVASALAKGETILVHGDYDVDGVCATALLTRWLTALRGRVVPFVPHRLRDGYDFSPAGLSAARDAGASLIVTADCGTVAHATIREARREGFDVIVTDHHTVAGALPDASAIVNPQRSDCPYPEKGLCGTGVAYKLCELVGSIAGGDPDELSAYLDLVALATVADLVPLTGENRVLVSYGLRRMGASRVKGLAALLEASGVAPTDVTAGRLGYVVAPRINAAGRMGDSADALRLLLTEDAREAADLATRLERTNEIRRSEDRRTLDEALDQLAESYDPEADFGIVLWSEGWHPGVIGIVASRVVERVHRPVVLVALDGEQGRGSARSVPGLHLYEALVECSAHLGRFGGHRQAAGMDVARDALPAFREAFNAAVRARLAPEDLRPAFRPDVEVSVRDLDLELTHWLSYLGPHGIGNPGPLFLARSVEVGHPKTVGERHLKATLVAEGARLGAIGFELAERYPPDVVAEGTFDVLFRLERNEWRGVASPQARLVDLRPAKGER